MTGNEGELNVYLGGVIIARLSLQHDQIFLQYTQDWQKVMPSHPIYHYSVKFQQ